MPRGCRAGSQPLGRYPSVAADQALMPPPALRRSEMQQVAAQMRRENERATRRLNRADGTTATYFHFNDLPLTPIREKESIDPCPAIVWTGRCPRSHSGGHSTGLRAPFLDGPWWTPSHLPVAQPSSAIRLIGRRELRGQHLLGAWPAWDPRCDRYRRRRAASGRRHGRAGGRISTAGSCRGIQRRSSRPEGAM